MTSSAIMGNELSKVIANNSKEVSKKNDIANTKHESFSKIMEKNNYNNKIDSRNKYEYDNKKVYQNSSKEMVSNGYSKKIKSNHSMEHKANKSFRKEKFAEDITDAINDIADAYKENLDISDEELISIMESLSINIFQLPLRELAKDIVIAANGENDITGLLVNENALNDLQSMNQFFDHYNPEKRLDMPVSELEGLVEEAVNNLMANKDQIVDNQMQQTQENGQLNNQVQGADGLSDVDAVANTDVISMVETIDIGDGKNIDIEIVDMRNNMTSDENALIQNNVLDNAIENTTNNQLNSEISSTLDNQVNQIENENLMKVAITDEILQNSVTEENVVENSVLNENIITNAVENEISGNVDENSNINNITNQDSLNNQTLQSEISNEQLSNVQVTESENSSQGVEAINQDMEVLNSNIDNQKNESKLDDNMKVYDSDNSTTDIISDKNINIAETETDAKQDSFGSNAKRQSDTKTPVETFSTKFITNLEKSLGIDEGSLLKEVSNIKEMREIVNQIIDKIKVNINKDSTTMKLNLNPEHLGKVELAVTSKAGVMTAEFVVENKTAKEAIEKGLPALIEKFEEQGLKVEAVEVSISDYDFTRQDGERRQANDYSHSDKKKKRGGKINMDDMSVDNEPPVARQRERKIMSSTGIDYTV